MKKILLVALIAVAAFCFRIDYLGERIREQGAASLSYPDKVAIWLFNFPMAIGGILIGAPEASAKTLPAPPCSLRSSYPLGSAGNLLHQNHSTPA